MKGLLKIAQAGLTIAKKQAEIAKQEPIAQQGITGLASKDTTTTEPSGIPVYKLPSDRTLTEEHLNKAILNSDLSGFVCDFETPAHLFLALVNDITPYKWQLEELKRIGGYYNLKDKIKPSVENPLRYLLKAANGSGKDQVIIAAVVVWYLCTAKRSRFVITSSSVEQIMKQTDPHIRWLCGLLNKYLGRTYVRSVQKYHAIPEIGSRAELRVTDEEGKAEGAHPDPGGRMAITINEAKSVSPEIYRAMTRCSGYDMWIEVSSPGQPQGRFYEKCLEAVEYPAPLVLGRYYMRTITGFDCPHLTEAQRLEILKEGGGGDTNPLYESSWLAQFSTIHEELCIHPYMLLASKVAPKIHGKKRFGLDIGGAGDPTVLFLLNGNQILQKFRFNEPDLVRQVERIFNYLSEFDFLDAEGYGDTNGIGQGVIDGLKHKGIKITGLFNQESAINSDQYINLGAELYFGIRDLVIGKVLHIDLQYSDLITQLTTRKYKIRGNGKKALESKKDYKKRTGLSSPDEADAFVLAFAGTTVATLLAESPKVTEIQYVDPREFNKQGSRLNKMVSDLVTSTKKKFSAWDI